MTERAKDHGDLQVEDSAPFDELRPKIDPEVSERRFREIVLPAAWKKLLAKSNKTDLDYVKLSEVIESMLVGRLRREGLSRAESILFARSAMADFGGISSLQSPEQVEAALDLGIAVFRAARKPSSDFEAAAEIALPAVAPEVWAQRDRTTKENPVAFLQRVWAPWLAARVLYQDDIKRLGDAQLIKAVRRYCHQKGLKASDVLPPPRQARLERALAEVVPGSAAERALQARLANREAVARWRRERRPSV